MNQRQLSTALLGLGCISSAMAAQKPNLLVIHTDEQNFRTLSCYQNQLPEDQAFVWGKGVNSTTPNIDRIAAEGAICMNYYCSSPVSTPSRGSMVTGLYPQHTGAPINGMMIREDIPTFATILSDNGYSTSYVGKWHLAGDDKKYDFNIKYKAGFADNRYMMTAGHAPYLRKTDDGMVGVNKKQGAKVDMEKEGLVHMTDYFTDATLEIIDRDKDKPFCIMVSIPDPHTPDVARAPYDTMYNHLTPEIPYTMRDEIADQRPAWGGARGSRNEADEFKPVSLLQYFGMVKHIDDCVGQMIARLEEHGILDNTIVVFTSDHGDLFFEHRRMNKDKPYAASSLIPFVIRYPEKITAGRVMNGAYVNTDFAPTILSLMGVESDAKFHGEDTAADFMAKKDSKQMLSRYVEFGECTGSWVALADSRYKLVLSRDEKPWLFDLESDPHEIVNQYSKSKYEGISKQMQTELNRQLELFESPALYKDKAPLIQ
ncbi:MAG: sulfatase-like hydrolase/transferase [Rikenellaceae bacterium]